MVESETLKMLGGAVREHAMIRVAREPLRVWGLPSPLWNASERGDVDVLDEELGDWIEAVPEDQIVMCGAGATLCAINEALVPHGQCIPAAPGPLDSDFSNWRLGDAIALNLPHALGAQCGSWTHWVLGVTAVLDQGQIVRMGSKVVKNVAGYDLHKMFVGARGTLGILAEVTLRTCPVGSRPNSSLVIVEPGAAPGPLWVQRTLAADFERAIEAAKDRTLAFDPASSTLWASVEPEDELPRFRGDWVLRSRCGDRNLSIEDQTLIDLMIRLKRGLDPNGKFNQGDFGFL